MVNVIMKSKEKEKKDVINDNVEKDDVKEEKGKKEEKGIKKVIKEIIPYIVILLVVVIVRTYLVTPIIVNGPSMKPTLDGGEVMILDKRGKLDRFDVVVVKVSRNGVKEEIIKRIIAMPGETIACENGIVYVNGRRQDEEYSMGTTDDFKLVELGDDEYFVMGDNREDSLDSRYFGAFKKSDIKGTTSLVLFPFGKIGNIE